MNIEILITKLLNYYQIKTLNDLAIKLDTTQSTISGWKARNAIGALTDTVVNKDPEALEYIFTNNKSIETQQIKEICNKSEIIETDEATFSLYKEAYLKAKKNEKIKEFRIYLMEYK